MSFFFKAPQRRLQALSGATAKVAVTVGTDDPVEATMTASGAQIDVSAPVGEDVVFEVESFDASDRRLARGSAIADIVEATENTVTVTLGGIPATINLAASDVTVDAVVPPAPGAGERGHRHELEVGRAQRHQVVEAVDGAEERALGRERADVGLVDHRLGEGHRLPGVQGGAGRRARRAGVCPGSQLRPADDFRRRLAVAWRASRHGTWIIRYGYLSDDKMKIVAEVCGQGGTPTQPRP